jgi:hypothetical protein
MYTRKTLTQEYLKTILNYNPETGVFTWNQKTCQASRIQPGDIAGCTNTRYQYIEITIHRVSYKAHRLAWLYVYGTWPKKHLDHINGNRIDNRLLNLRESTSRENQQNRIEHRNGHLVGSSFRKDIKKWQSTIVINKKKRHLGFFNTKEEAHQRYLLELDKIS